MPPIPKWLAAGTALAWPLVAWWLLEQFRAGMMASVFAFLIVPSAIVALARRSTIASALAFSVLVGVPAIVWIDEIATRNGQWLVVDRLETRLPLIGASAQSIIWAVAHFFASVLAWEYIKGSSNMPRLSSGPHAWRVVTSTACAWSLLAMFFVVRAWWPGLLDIPHFYLAFGLSLIAAPVLAACLLRPWLVRPLLLLALVGAYWKTIYEIAALSNDWWRFPGEFVGWIDLFGYPIPVEELFFWILLFSPAIAVFWEFWSGPKPSPLVRSR